MEPQAIERRLTTILSADIMGYSRLMGEAEAATLAALKAHRKSLIEELEKVSWTFAGYSATLIDCYVELQRLDDARAELAKLLEAMPGASVDTLSGYLPYNSQALVDGLLLSLQEAGLPG